PCTTSQPHHPLLYSCPDNPLDISKSPIQEAQCRVTSNLPIPPSASWARVRGGQAVPHYRRYPGTRTGFLRPEQCPDSVQDLRMEWLQRGAQTWSYVGMPDPFRWWMQSEAESLGRVVGRGRAGRARRIGRRIWQRRFHDRAVRRGDDLKALARYAIA